MKVEFENPNIKFEGEIKNGKLIVKKACLYDFGWVWLWGADNPGLFIVRIFNSKYWNDFKKSLIKQGVTAKMIKELLIQDIEGTMYGLSGDNRTWFFKEYFNYEDETFTWDVIENWHIKKNSKFLTKDEICELLNEKFDWYIDIDELEKEFYKKWKNFTLKELEKIENWEHLEQILDYLNDELKNEAMNLYIEKLTEKFINFLKENGYEYERY